ncbi:MAG TPA: hypothetical protein PK777_06770, partial [Thermoguttaceae bacterium]|nr:hypothetical protein [Thermoguttaceae bacterium]
AQPFEKRTTMDTVDRFHGAASLVNGKNPPISRMFPALPTELHPSRRAEAKPPQSLIPEIRTVKESLKCRFASGSLAW